ncbi:hypothetical protein [Neolewinella agarilytica]|uniref:hypothetical protein n=1 Tax=Neolewinella agarilytica TaxID=478744 RepID=UPI002354130A|nr:hypothetical protein [Neolewinella agarilytica]
MPSPFEEIVNKIGDTPMIEVIEELRELVSVSYPAFLAEVLAFAAEQNDIDEKTENRAWTPGYEGPARRQLIIDVMNLIERIETRQDDHEPRQKQAVDKYHAYAVNRHDQMDGLTKHKKEGGICQYYILQGNELHEHEHFFHRVARELMGCYRDVDNPLLRNESKVEMLTPYFVPLKRDEEAYRKALLQKLYDKAGMDANAHAPLLEKDITHFWKQGPRTASLGSGDYICIFFQLDDPSYDPDTAVNTVNWFIDYIEKAPLPEDAPRLLIFFSFEFDEDDEDEARDVRDAIGMIPRAKSIPEFEKVGSRDVIRWLKTYRKLIDPIHPKIWVEGDEDDPVRFQKGRDYYMADINPVLQQLIKDYNKKQV